MKRILTLVFLISSVLLFGQNNLLQNGDFSDGLNGWNNLGGTNISTQNGALEICDGIGDIRIIQTVGNINPSAVYEFVVEAPASTNIIGTPVGVKWLTSSFQPIVTSFTRDFDPTPDGNGLILSSVFSPPANAAFAEITAFDGSQGACVLFDNFSFRLNSNNPEIDLAITNPDFLSSWQPSGVFRANFDVVNTGTLNAFGAQYEILLSTDQTPSADDRVSITDFLPTVNAGSSVSVNRNIGFPNTPAGSYFVIVVVDSGDAFAEPNEANNIFATPITIGGTGGQLPDYTNLEWLDATTQLTQVPQTGSLNYPNFSIENVGPIGVAAPLLFRLIPDPANPSVFKDFQAGANFVGTTTFTLSFAVNNFTPGIYPNAVIIADPLNEIPESNENNNSTISLPTFEILGGGTGGGGDIDLELELNQTPANPNQWDFYSVTATLTNSGPQTATDIEVEFPAPAGVVYQGGNAFDAQSGTFTEFGDETWRINSLAAGQSTTLTVNYFLLTVDAPLAYAEVVGADQTDSDSTPGNGTPPTPNEDDEATTDGNGGGGGGPVNKADLTLSDLNFTNASVMAGDQLNFTFDLNNVGTANAAGNFNIKAFISTDSQLDAGDIQDGIVPTGNLPAGATVQDVLGASTIPAGLAAGNYFLILQVDADNQIGESNENNNTVVSAFTIAPDPTGGDDCAFITRAPYNGVVRFRGFNEFSVTDNNATIAIDYQASNTSFNIDTRPEGQVVLNAVGELTSSSDNPNAFDTDISVTRVVPDTVIFTFNNVPGFTPGIEKKYWVEEAVGKTSIVLSSQAVQTNTGFAVGGAIIDVDGPQRARNFVLSVDDQGEDPKVALINSPSFFGGFAALVEGTDGALYTTWSVSGDFSLACVAPNRTDAWTFRVASDTPSSQWTDLKVSIDNSTVLASVRDNFAAFVYVLNATDGTQRRRDNMRDIFASLDPDLFFANIFGIVPTNDGGYLTSFQLRNPANSGLALNFVGKVSATGTEEWVQQVSTGFMNIIPLDVDGDAAYFAGATGQNTDSVIFIRTINNGQLTPRCGGGGTGGDGPDLEVAISVPSTNLGLWENVPVTVTASNTGTEPMTGIDIDLIVCGTSSSGFESSNQLVYSDIGSADVGDWDFLRQVWTIPTLAPGETATLNVGLFTTGAGVKTLNAVATAYNETDVDSSPSDVPFNGTTFGCTDGEDDAVALELSVAGNRLSAFAKPLIQGAPVQVLNIYPNPSSLGEVNILIQSNAPRQELLQISDARGSIITQRQLELRTGENYIHLSTIDFVDGMYFLLFPGREIKESPKSFVVQER